MDEITKTIFDFIRDRFEIGDDPEFTPEVHLFDSGFVDSLGAMEIVSFVEGAFGTKITQRDITLYPMNSAAEIAAVIRGKLAEAE